MGPGTLRRPRAGGQRPASHAMQAGSRDCRVSPGWGASPPTSSSVTGLMFLEAPAPAWQAWQGGQAWHGGVRVREAQVRAGPGTCQPSAAASRPRHSRRRSSSSSHPPAMIVLPTLVEPVNCGAHGGAPAPAHAISSGKLWELSGRRACDATPQAARQASDSSRHAARLHPAFLPASTRIPGPNPQAALPSPAPAPPLTATLSMSSWVVMASPHSLPLPARRRPPWRGAAADCRWGCALAGRSRGATPGLQPPATLAGRAGDRQQAAPATAPIQSVSGGLPVRTLSTPGGTPASSASWPRRSAVRGVYWDTCAWRGRWTGAAGAAQCE